MYVVKLAEIEIISSALGSHYHFEHGVVVGFVSQFLSTKTPFCIIYCFERKLQAWYASPVQCTLDYLLGPKGQQREFCSNR